MTAKTETLSAAIPEDVEHDVYRLLKAICDKELKLVTAESCTGGLLASLLTDVDGSGHAFERGFVTYTDEAKHEMLGVDAGLLKDKGAVSKEVAIAMAEGALARSSGDLALSVTGFAGPAGEDDEEGLVHFGLARRDGETLHREEHFGPCGRGEVRLKSLRAALKMLDEALWRRGTYRT
jgi:nicotinamide-nucleotide amidase